MPCARHIWVHADPPLADIFGSGSNSDDVAAQWFQRYQENDAQALTDLINCVLLATGCDQHLTEDDIRDPENSANRLSELEEAFEQVGPPRSLRCRTSAKTAPLD